MTIRSSDNVRLDQLAVLTGGIGGWQAAGCEVVRQSERWSLERQVRLVAGSMSMPSSANSPRVPPEVAADWNRDPWEGPS